MEKRDTGREIEALRATLRILRGKDGCPWDREQSMGDITSYLIDETYELLHAEKSGDLKHIEEEFGDVFYLVIFIHELMLERNGLPFADIIARIHKKIISRHPHVFGTTSAENCHESVAEWERIKKSEKGPLKNLPALQDIPAGLPPMRHAFSVHKKAAAVGFDWPDHRGVIDKLFEEIEELKDAVDSGNKDNIREEIGDLFFTVINLARKLGIDSESALAGSSAKFIKRFNIMEENARAQGMDLESMSRENLEVIWQDSKIRKQ